MYVYDVCDVTLSVYPYRASLKNMPSHGGNRTYDLWNTSPMLCQLSYAVRTDMYIIYIYVYVYVYIYVYIYIYMYIYVYIYILINRSIL